MTVKTFRVENNPNPSKHKYHVRFHDGHKTHPDGSAFFDLRSFKNKTDLQKFTDALAADGYTRNDHNTTGNPDQPTHPTTLVGVR